MHHCTRLLIRGIIGPSQNATHGSSTLLLEI